MPNNSISAKSVVSIVLTVAAILFASTADGIEPDQSESNASMNEIRRDLESGVPVEKQEPFEARALRPYSEEDWIGNAVAYGCYREGQAPGIKGPSDAELLEDLTIIAKHWGMIRVYGSDNDTKRMLRVIDEHQLPIKVIQGIWLSPEEDNPQEKQANINSVLLGIELANQYPDIVIAVSVGNETQVFWSGHRMDPETLIRYIRTVRANVAVPVATADDYLFWNKPESRQVATETDFIFTHIHPLWNGKTLATAIEWFDQIYREIQELHPDRTIVIGETGWATDYNAAKIGPGEQGTLIKGEVGLEAQASFLIQMDQWVESNRVATFLFEAFDEPWKGGGDDSPSSEIEKNWGVFNEDRTPKESFNTYLEFKRKADD
jgi:exo-beta-1,3-glucanase (GH17 family)